MYIIQMYIVYERRFCRTKNVTSTSHAIRDVIINYNTSIISSSSLLLFYVSGGVGGTSTRVSDKREQSFRSRTTYTHIRNAQRTPTTMWAYIHDDKVAPARLFAYNNIYNNEMSRTGTQYDLRAIYSVPRPSADLHPLPPRKKPFLYPRRPISRSSVYIIYTSVWVCV